MTQFRVLPIRRGDAYLLKSSRGGYLVDGGEHGCELPELLEDRKVRKLRAAICTSACQERLGGILELLDSGHNVAEYWLPEGLEAITEMARRFNGDWEGWLKLLDKDSTKPAISSQQPWPKLLQTGPPNDVQRRLEGASVLIGLALTACLGWSTYTNLSRETYWGHGRRDPMAGLTHYFNWTLEILSDRAARRWRENKTPITRILRRMGWQLYHGGGPEDLALLCGRLLLAESELLPGGDERGTRAIVQGLAMAAMTAALLAKTTPKLRFFRQTGRLETTLVPRHPIKCVNGIEVSPLEGLAPTATPQALLNEAQFLSAHRNGLVFQYGDPDCSVLFCSDTRMSFLPQNHKFQLDRPTVITAPRQGTCSSERAYNFIASTNPRRDVWVRSHYSNARKVSSDFKKQHNKTCLNNCVHLTLQEILIEYADNQWTHLAGGGCVCK